MCGLIVHGEWLSEIREAAKARIISISALELMNCAALVAIMAERRITHGGDKKVVQNENTAAEDTIGSSRATSPTMLAAIRCFHDAMVAAGWHFLGAQIAGVINRIADALSRGEVALAMKLSRKKNGRADIVQPREDGANGWRLGKVMWRQGRQGCQSRTKGK